MADYDSGFGHRRFFPDAARLREIMVDRAYEIMRDEFATGGAVPPSMEQVNEAARRHPTWDALAVIQDVRARLASYGPGAAESDGG